MSTLHRFLDPERLAELARDPAEHRTTGEPTHMLQYCSREFTEWLANKPDARRRVREAAADIRSKQGERNG